MILRKKTMQKKDAAGECPSSWLKSHTRIESRMRTFRYRSPAAERRYEHMAYSANKDQRQERWETWLPCGLNRMHQITQ